MTIALDTITIAALVEEFSRCLTNGRIDKIHQPEKDEILLQIRTYQEHYKLVLSANSAHPRAHFTDIMKKNPQTPPMFCMLLRKHLSSGKILRVEQVDYERVIRFDIESYNELGDLTVKHLYAELMGRNSNLILTDSEKRIIDAVKHIDFTLSSVRQILPGGTYIAPPAQEKVAYLSPERESAKLSFEHSGIRADKAIMEVISGISPMMARELVYRCLGRCDYLCGELNEAQKAKLSEFVCKADFEEFPCMLIDATTEKVIDFSAIRIEQMENLAKVIPYQSASKLLDDFYQKKDSTERMRQKSADLVKLLHSNLERLNKKMVIQIKSLQDAENKEQYKVFGDLLMANLYRMMQGEVQIEVENYYEDTMPKIVISLNPAWTPTQNAQHFYKLYQKAKTAEIEVAKQLEMTKADIEYLESTLVLVEQCKTVEDLNAIRSELAEQGYVKRQIVKGKPVKPTSKPMHFISSDGFDIYVGKNNTQNDYLTLRFANQQDIWFHTKKIHGSHVIIKLGIDKDVPKTTMLEAATLAAYYSKARESSQVPVDYTTVKNVKKPNGAKPGMVIYDSYNTVYVSPRELDLKQE